MVRRWAITTSVGVTVACLVAGCSSSGGSTANPGGSSSQSQSSSATASKTPINIFFINEQGASSGASYPQETDAAKAAVAYINDKLGGVDGHPIKLATCFTDATPASATTCANKAVAADPLLISAGTLATDDSLIGVTGKTDIPYVSNAGFTSATLTAKGKAFIISNYADVSNTTMPQLMKQNGVKKVAEVYVNVPGVVNGLLPLAEKVDDKMGIKYDKYPVAYPTADMTATISAIAGTDADAIHFQADPVTCGAALNAIKSLGFDKPLYTPSACRSAANNKIVAGMSQPIYTQLSTLPSTSDDPDVAIMKEVFGATSSLSKLQDDQWALDGFTDIFNIYAALKKASESGDVTRASLISALEAGGLHQFMLGPDVTFKCDGSVMPDLPALCSLATLLGDWKGDTIENIKAYDGANALK